MSSYSIIFISDSEQSDPRNSLTVYNIYVWKNNMNNWQIARIC